MTLLGVTGIVVSPEPCYPNLVLVSAAGLAVVPLEPDPPHLTSDPRSHRPVNRPSLPS
jgi:hypothetical protein